MKSLIAKAYRAPVARSTLSYILAVLLFYGGTLVEKAAQDAFPQSIPRSATIVALLVVGAIVFGLAAGVVRSLALAEEERDRLRRDAIIYAASTMDQHISGRAQQIRTKGRLDVLASPEWHLEGIGLIVKGFYQLLEAKFGQSARLADRTNFEVTFMTKSYRDDQITIPAFANRSGREPVSMGKRRENPTIYENTYTATVYREATTGVPAPKLVEDTGHPAEKYQELYPAQRDRIQSLFVSPVLSDKNVVLGTIVAHCDRAGFFQRADERFWRELVDTFARQIAYEKLCLDIAVATKAEDAPF